MMKSLSAMNATQKITLCASVALYVISLIQPAVHINNTYNLPGVQMLLVGVFAIFDGIEGIAWFANPFYLISIILFIKQKKSGSMFALAGTLLAFSFLFWKEIYTSRYGDTKIESLGLGYYLWLMSIILLFAATWIGNNKAANASEAIS